MPPGPRELRNEHACAAGYVGYGQTACILLYPAYAFSRWIRIRQMVKGQGVDKYVGLYSDCIF